MRSEKEIVKQILAAAKECKMQNDLLEWMIESSYTETLCWALKKPRTVLWKALTDVNVLLLDAGPLPVGSGYWRRLMRIKNALEWIFYEE